MKARILNSKTILLSSWIFFLMVSCHPDREDVTLVDTYIPSPEIILPYTGDLQVYISDVDNEALEGVEVYVYDEKQVSDAYGMVQFTGIQLDKNGTYVRALKDNYLFGSDRFFPEGQSNYTVIRMFPLEKFKSFNSTQAVSIEVEGGGVIDFPADAFEMQQGGKYTGDVKVFAQRIATNDPDISDIMPGSLLAEDKLGKTQVLGTLGMVAVKLFGEGDVPLQLSNGKNATVHFLIAPEVLEAAPELIPLWHFDEVAGLWREGGNATKDGNFYIGQVSHFSFWNCDVPFDLVSMSGRVVNSSDEGVAYAKIEILSSTFGVSYGYTDGNGYFGGKIPKGELLTIKVYLQSCQNAVYETQIGGFDSNVLLDDIMLAASFQDVSGIVNCLGVPEPNSEVIISTPTNNYLVPTNAQGQFNFQILESLCNSQLPLEIRAVRTSDNSASESVSVDLEDATDLAFEVCADCNFDVELSTVLGPVCSNSAVISAFVENGSGSYTYSWSTGSVDTFITVLLNDQYCVTVTDVVTECDVIACTTTEMITTPITTSMIIQNITCSNFGSIILDVSGGTPFYSFSWIGPGGFTSTDSDLVELELEGLYSCTITDANSCVKEVEVVLQNETLTYDVAIITSTNSNVICGDESIILEVICSNCGFSPQFMWTLPGGTSLTTGSIVVTEGGNYTVELVGGDCDGFASIDIIKVEFETPAIAIQCDIDGYYFEVFGINPNHTVEAPFVTNEERIENFQGTIEQTIFVNSEYSNCYQAYDAILPYVDGEPIVVVSPPTCGTCSDGYIEYDLDKITPVNTSIGSVALYAEGAYTDNLSQDNLSLGVYYFVILSADGCVIFSQLIDL